MMDRDTDGKHWVKGTREVRTFANQKYTPLFSTHALQRGSVSRNGTVWDEL